MRALSRIFTRRRALMAILTGAAIGLPTILSAQIPQWPLYRTRVQWKCPFTYNVCPDCTAPTAGAIACQYKCPTGGTCNAWTMSQCAYVPTMPGAPTCSDTYFDCGTNIFCASGLPSGGNCSNNIWCKS